ncbi:UDP-glucose/GDP-mannose dehydrogenase family protein [Gammaproteobacteria bacterium]|nr:UDP-glucose/GDP-mannose dehydrogenase family protein [Gammaproteobacteria bacterium]
MNIVIIGTGYVGLVSGACFAEFGENVTCIDKNEELIDKLNSGIIPIYEPGLEDLVKRNTKSMRLTFKTKMEDAVGSADIVFIAVGTPSRRGDGHADLKYVYEVAEELSQNMKGHTLIVDKSTVPVGTARKVKEIISNGDITVDFDIASNPEFLREGSAINDFMNPDRVILGIENTKAEGILKALYRPLKQKGVTIVTSDLESAELTKYASNAFLATKISFINEISELCEKTGADVDSVAYGMGLDRRIGSDFLRTGPGYGGSCFPKDTLALIKMADDNKSSSKIVSAVADANDYQKNRMVSKIINSFPEGTSDKQITILGLTFKPKTDDMREAPSLTIIPALLKHGIKVIAHDPVGIEEAKKLLPNETEFRDSIYEACVGSHAIVLVTDWDEYKEVDLQKILGNMNSNILIDLRNSFQKERINALGFKYSCIGKKN